MKAYGLPRVKDLENPDVADIQNYGLKSSVGRLLEKGGDFKGYIRSKVNKALTRRIWKKRARNIQKADLALRIEEAICGCI